MPTKGEVGGIAGRDTVLGDGFVEFAEGEVDVRGGHEPAGEGGSELGAEAVGFRDLALGASVEKAERRVIVLAEHATGAAIGERELAERGIVGGDAGTGAFWFIHGFFLKRDRFVNSGAPSQEWLGHIETPGGSRMCGKQRTCGRAILDLWQ